MDLINRSALIYNSPSRRSDIDYNKSISPEAIKGVISLFRQLPNRGATLIWFHGVSQDFVNLYPDFNTYREWMLANYSDTPLLVFEKFLLNPSTEPVAFLDFLETVFKNNAAEIDNDLIESVNSVLEKSECAYRLTKFVKHKVLAQNYPKVYLAPNSAIDSYSIEPLRELFSNPDFVGPEKSFHKALERYKLEDYSGCVTSCTAAIESSIKVIAKKKNLKIKGKGVGTLLQSLISESRLPSRLSTVAGYFSERRQSIGDAHGNPDLAETTDAEIQFFISLTAALIVYMATELYS